jgi:hypothetical protein
MKNLFTFLTIFYVSFLPNILTANTISNSLDINALSIDKNISGIIRTICFDNNTFLLVTNSYGSDIELVNKNNCEDAGVIDYDFIYSRKISPNISGLVRKIEVNGVNLYVYSGKKSAPSITIVEN